MAWPLAIMAASAVASAAMQWYNSKQAQDANQDERDAMRALINKVQDPNFDMRFIAPEDVKLLQQFVPETVPYVEEVAPQQVKAASAGAVQGRQSQLDALGKMRQLMNQGYDPQTAIEMARAERGMGAEAASARATGQMEAQRRGFAGGPSAYALGAAQAGQDSLAALQQQALAGAAQRRFQAAQQVGSMGSQIRGEDVNLEQANVNAINAFNQRQASSKQNWMQQQADTRNQATLRNMGEAQRIYEGNKMRNYDAQVRQQGMQNTLAQQQYQNALGKATGQMPISTQQQQGNIQSAEQQNKSIQAMTDLAAKIAMEKYGYDNKDKYQKG